MRSLFFFLSFQFLLFLNLPLYAEDDCLAGIITVTDEKRAEDAVDIVLENHKSTDMTVTLEATLSNMQSSVPLPYTITVRGNSETILATFKVVNKRDAWKYSYKYFWTWGSTHATHDNSITYDLPYKDQPHAVIQGFNGQFSHFGDSQYAIDFGMPEGTPVYAAREGTVVDTVGQYTTGGVSERFRNCVNVIVIKHDDGTFGEYDHLRYQGVVVTVGQRVGKGDLIGYSGNTGYSSGPHLHFFVYKAIDGKKRQSFPIIFNVKESQAPVTLVEGQSYSHQ